MLFEEVNIRETVAAVRELQKLGVMATPALMIGDRLVVGFDREKIDQAVAVLGQQTV